MGTGGTISKVLTFLSLKSYKEREKNGAEKKKKFEEILGKISERHRLQI